MGIIQCGSFTGNTTVNIGWEPQWIMIKRTDAAGDWIVIDSMRGCSVGGIDAVLNPNLSNAESIANDYIDFTATGFISKNLTGTYIYTVIRRPNKPPTSGTEVFFNDADAANSGGSNEGLSRGFDLGIISSRAGGTNWEWIDRLRGLGLSTTSTLTTAANSLSSNAIAAETSSTLIAATVNQGVARPTKTFARVVYTLKRAPGFMDIVCWKGTGVAGGVVQIAHNLGVMPELAISKERSGNIRSWAVSYKSGADRKRLNLEDNSAAVTSGYWDAAFPTSSTFDEYFVFTSQLTSTCVTYLFASLPGVSKVGSYTGNGSSQTINCGFSAGARFILIKRTDTSGDWYVWDYVRGIVAANDPHLSLNTTAAEVTTDDSVDPDNSGFIVNQNTATNINVNGGSYIFLAIA